MNQIRISNRYAPAKDTSNEILVYQFILYVAMMSGYKGIAYYISLFVVALFAVKIFTRNGIHLPKNKSWSSFVLFLIFYAASSSVNFHKETFTTYLMYYTLVFFPILIGDYLIKNSTTEMIKKSLKCFSYVFIGFSLISITYYWANPGLARDMAAHLVDDRLAIGGGYLLAYAATVLCVYLFSKMVNKRIDRSPKHIFLCLLCVYLVYLTESSITFFALVIGLVLSLIFKKRETSKITTNEFMKFFFLAIFIILAVSLIVYNKYAIADWLLSMTRGKDNIMFSRIEEIINNIVYGKTNFHVNKRNDTLTKSIEIFMQNPIFGIGYKYGYVYSYGAMYGIGNHSEILDAFARYGVLGGILWLYPFFATIKMIFKKNFGCAITILLLMYFNPFLAFHSNAVLFMFIPLFEELLKRIELEENSDSVNEVS